MIRNYYTLKHLVSEFNILEGGLIEEIFTQEKDSATINLLLKSGETNLHIATGGKFDSIYIRDNFAKAGKNATTIFEDLEGDVFQNAELLENQRIIKLAFLNTDLYAILYGGNNSNLIATTKKRKIFDSLNDKNNLIGSQFEPKPNNLPKINEFPKSTTISKAIANSDFMLGRYYTEQFIHENQLSANSLLSDFSQIEIEHIISQIVPFIETLISTKKYYLLENNGSALLSLLPLAKYPKVIAEFESISKAIKRANSYNFHQSQFLPLFKLLNNRLLKLAKNYQKKIDSFSEEAYSKRQENYRLFADILSSHHNVNQSGNNELITNDYENNPIIIPLNTEKTIIENANRYYQKIKDSKAEQKARSAMLPKVMKKLNEVNEAIVILNSAKKMKELENLYVKFGKELRINIQDNRMEREEKFRKFELEGGFMLYVGKNASNNDELTMKFAKPNDIWLHSRGSSGSHGVIRVESGKKVPKKIIEQAGAIVAYYSGQKNSTYCPICYTEKKNVRKPKGAATGSVIISREKVVMVTPRLPKDTEEQ